MAILNACRSLILSPIISAFRLLSVVVTVCRGCAASRSSTSGKRRRGLSVFFVPTSRLGEKAMEEVYHFFNKSIVTEVSAQYFQTVSESFSHIALFRERVDGSLHGITFYDIDRNRKTKENYKYTLVKGGFASIDPEYRGSPEFMVVLSSILLKEKLCRPRIPLYLGGNLFSYKMYLITLLNFTSVYPRHDAETPSLMKSIIDDIGSKVLHGQKYDAQTGIVSQDKIVLKENLAPITDQHLQNPHIQFYVRANPGSNKGDMLASVAEVRWQDLLTGLLFSSLKKRKGSRK